MIAASILVIGCHGKPQGPAETPDAALITPSDGGACTSAMTHETPLMAASHVPQDTVVDWSSNPPSSGPHYPTLEPWATVYPIVVPRGNYLHNEEHGGVVLLYNCDDGCPDVVQGLTTLAMSLPHDPACPSTMNARWIITRDPLLPAGIQVAAAAWGWTYRAECLDEPSLSAFITARYAQGGSDRTNCTDGVPTP